MSAAKQTMNAQALATHNLANAGTTGFKADFEAMRAMQVYGPGHPAPRRGNLGLPGAGRPYGSLSCQFDMSGDERRPSR